jgi:hypothetical protein
MWIIQNLAENFIHIPSPFLLWQNCTMLDTVSSAIAHVLLMQTGQNKIDEQSNAVCITPTPSHVCWLLCNFSNHSENIQVRLDDGPTFFCDLTLIL